MCPGLPRTLVSSEVHNKPQRERFEENSPPSIRNLAQVVLLLSTYYSKLLFEGRFGIISNIGRERKGIFAEQFGTFIDRFCNCKHAYRSRFIGIPRIVVRESAPTILRERCQKWRHKTRGRWWQRVEIKSMQFPVGWVHSSRCKTRLLSSGKGLKLALLPVDGQLIWGDKWGGEGKHLEKTAE